jgi:hypothetical protein
MSRRVRKEVRQGEVTPLLVCLFILPFLILILFCAALSFSVAQPVFPPVWLLLVTLGFPLLLACVLFAAYRALVFAFFRDVALRVCQALGIEITVSESELAPFLLFHAGQEFEIIAESMDAWRTDLAVQLDRASSGSGLWLPEAHARFPYASDTPCYRNKSNELKKIKGHQNVRPAAVLALFITLKGEESLNPKKRAEILSALCSDVLTRGERYGGLAAFVAGNALCLVFSSSNDEKTCAVGALRAAKEIFDHVTKTYRGAKLCVLADYFPVCESMLQAGKTWRYHVESPDIAAIRAAAAAPVTEARCGLRFSARIVERARAPKIGISDASDRNAPGGNRSEVIGRRA